MSAPDSERAALAAAPRPLSVIGRLASALAIAAGLVMQAGVVWVAAHGVPDTSAAVLAGQTGAALAEPSWGGLAGTTNTVLLLICFAVQALAAILVTAGSAAPLRAHQRAGSVAMFGYLWVFNFAVPFGGLVCTLVVLFIGMRLPRREHDLPIHLVTEPQYATRLVSGSHRYGSGARLKAQLQNADLDTSFRMAALLALQQMPSRTVSPLLQGMLADPLDDIRLLAYGILDNREKVLTQRILAERAKLDGRAQPAATGEARRLVNKELARLYSELIYEQLVKGDVYHNAARQADAYAKAALDADASDASLWRLRGRLALDARDLDAADTMLQRAIDCGFPRERMLPYLAEVAYLRHDYARVRALLAELEQHGAWPTLRAVLDFWNAPRHTAGQGA